MPVIECKVGREGGTEIPAVCYVDSDIPPQPVFAITESVNGFPQTLVGIFICQSGEPKFVLQKRTGFQHDGIPMINWTALLFTPSKSINDYEVLKAEVANG